MTRHIDVTDPLRDPITAMTTVMTMAAAEGKTTVLFAEAIVIMGVTAAVARDVAGLEQGLRHHGTALTTTSGTPHKTAAPPKPYPAGPMDEQTDTPPREAAVRVQLKATGRQEEPIETYEVSALAMTQMHLSQRSIDVDDPTQ